MRTQVRAAGRWWPFQEFMIRHRAQGPVEGVEFAGAPDATVTPEVLDALASARAIVIGPSNPVISIGPMLAVPGLREAVVAAPAPVVAVSPLVGGEVLKGPTEAFMAYAGAPLTADGVAGIYEGLIDGLVADERADGVPDARDRRADGRRRIAAARRARDAGVRRGAADLVSTPR